MQFYTVVGAVIVAACGLESARRLNGEAEESINMIEAYLSLLRYVRAQIDCYALPIGDIFEKCDNERLFACGWIDNAKPRGFDELFLCSNINDKAARDIISEFCSDFGQNYREEQLKRCDFCISALESRREEMLARLSDKKKLNFALCLSASLAVIILLV